MLDHARVVVAALALTSAANAELPARAQIVARERSLYQTILVTREPSRLCMRFALRDSRRTQSCVDPANPKRMVFSYTRMMMAALLLAPAPKRVLIVGLGGGTLPVAFAELLPDARIDVAEVDHAVVEAAKKHFGFRPSERLRVHVRDARVFVKRAIAANVRYDAVLLDAYNADYIPEHLLTVEFINEARRLLAPNGVLAANTFGTSRLYDHESQTYREVFGAFFNLKTPASHNRIILAANGELPAPQLLRDRANLWQARLRPYDVPLRDYAARLTTAADWDATARPLTDQYSPANLLRTRK